MPRLPLIRRRDPRPAAPAEPPVEERLQPLVEEIGKLWESAAHLPLLDQQMDARLRHLDTHVAERMQSVCARLEAVEARFRELEQRALDWRVAMLEERAHEQRAEQILALSSWIAQLPPQHVRVSVLMSTRNRAHVVGRAIESVLAQTHEHWELVIVDDGSTDHTPDVVAAFDDPRIVVRRIGGAGQATGLNTALELATGDLIAYLDDDNTMHRQWLATVAWAFGRFADTDVVYGARVREPELMENRRLPVLWFDDWRRGLHERYNVIDQNVLAHRAGLAEARLDPRVRYGADWELTLRLTRHKDPIALPAIAAFYHSSATDRLSMDPAAAGAYDTIRRRALRARPVRVAVVHDGPANALEHRAALVAAGADVQAVGPAELPALLDHFAPDVVAVETPDDVGPVLAAVERADVPIVLFGAVGMPPCDPAGDHWPEADPAASVEKLRQAVERHRGLAAPVRRRAAAVAASPS